VAIGPQRKKKGVLEWVSTTSGQPGQGKTGADDRGKSGEYAPHNLVEEVKTSPDPVELEGCRELPLNSTTLQNTKKQRGGKGEKNNCGGCSRGEKK